MSSPSNNNKARAIAKIKNVMANVRGRRSGAYMGYMNNTTGWFVRTPKIVGRTITFKCDFSKLQVPATLPRGFLSMEGRYALNAPAVVRVTNSHGIVGSGTVNHWYIKTTNGFALVHRSGTVQISSPNATGRVAQQLERVGLTGISNARVTKFDAETRINRVINFDALGRYFPNSLGSYSFEPELANRATVKWNSPSMTLILQPSGKIQILGAARPKDAVDVMRRIIEHAKPDRIFKQARYELFGRKNYEVAVPRMRNETRNEKLAKNRMSKLNVRHSPVSGYNIVPPPGKYVRPGPNGKPRLYNVPGDLKLSATKVRKAYENAGVNMPQHVRNIFGTVNAMAWYGASKGANRAPSWNAKKNGHYVAPGPGKQPHFYKLPKDLKGGFTTAKARYNKAGMNVPQHVRNLFSAGTPSGPALFVKPNTHVVQNNKVNGTAYKKLTTNQLVAIARNLGNAGANSKMTKEVLFNRIASRATIKSASPVRAPNVSVNGRVYIFSNNPLNQHIVRNGRKRMFSTLPKNERTAIMNRYFRGNTQYKAFKPGDWYNLLRAHKPHRVATPPVSVAASRASSTRSRSSTPNLGLGMPTNIP